jgi:hypothetical protein
VSYQPQLDRFLQSYGQSFLRIAHTPSLQSKYQTGPLSSPSVIWDSYVYGQMDFRTEATGIFLKNGHLVLFFWKGGALYKDTNTRYGHPDGWKGAAAADIGDYKYCLAHQAGFGQGQSYRARFDS